MKTFCIVGLGNPAQKYERTYHNIGFEILDAFLRSHDPHQKFSFSKKHNTEIAEISLNETKLILLKPQTYMNRSGHAVSSILEYYKLSFENDLLLVHDDLDLPFGKIRFSRDSGSAGHNGVSSVTNQLGSQNFTRLRFGIAKDAQTANPEKSEVFVLKNLSNQQQEELPDLLNHCNSAIDHFVANGFEYSATIFNQEAK